MPEPTAGPTATERMVDAAFALFDEQGYDATTVEQIVERAGVSRSTFFRAFGSKEDVIFPRHEDLQARIAARLATGTRETYPVAVAEAARLVLDHYLSEGELARIRYRLTRAVPALRDREVASMLGYQRLFREHLRGWLAGLGDADVDLHAELLAAGVVTAHNVVLRRWLRGEGGDPAREFEEAMSAALATTRTGTTGSTVVVVSSALAPDAAARAVRDALR
ncbi:hypothetical protein BH11ACT8_BH11ACT8_03730 [soil metagenome]